MIFCKLRLKISVHFDVGDTVHTNRIWATINLSYTSIVT